MLLQTFILKTRLLTKKINQGFIADEYQTHVNLITKYYTTDVNFQFLAIMFQNSIKNNIY